MLSQKRKEEVPAYEHAKTNKKEDIEKLIAVIAEHEKKQEAQEVTDKTVIMEQAKKDLRQLNFTEDKMEEAQAITNRIADFKKQRDAAKQGSRSMDATSPRTATTKVGRQTTKRGHVRQRKRHGQGGDWDFRQKREDHCQPCQGKVQRCSGVRSTMPSRTGVCSMGARTGTGLRDGKGERGEHR